MYNDIGKNEFCILTDATDNIDVKFKKLKKNNSTDIIIYLNTSSNISITTSIICIDGCIDNRSVIKLYRHNIILKNYNEKDIFILFIDFDSNEYDIKYSYNNKILKVNFKKKVNI